MLMFAVSAASEAQSAVPHCWDGQRVGMEGVSILSDKVSILSSEWQNLSLFLGNIGDYILQRRHSWNYFIQTLILLWCVVNTQQLSFTNESLLKTVSHFVPRSMVPVSGVPGAPVPVADCHWSQPSQSHSRAEANLGAGDFGHCVQELCCAILRWKKMFICL